MLGKGTQLLINDGTTDVAVAHLLDISGPKISQNAVDVTTHQSAWKEYVAGVTDGGEVAFDIIYDPADASHGLLKTAASDGQVHAFKITFPDGTTWSFSGVVTAFEIAAPVEDKLTASISIKVSGAIA